MTCKECLYYEACEHYNNGDAAELAENAVETKCPIFKEKSHFVELPCVAMVERFIKNGEFDRYRTAYNGRYAVVYIDKKKWNCPLIDITEQSYNSEKAEEQIQVLKGEGR